MTTKTKAKNNFRWVTSNRTKMTHTEMQNPKESIDCNAVNPDNQKHTSGHQKSKFQNVPNQKNEISKNSHKSRQQTQTQTGRTLGTENRTKTVPKYEKPYRTVRFQESKKSMNGQRQFKESVIRGMVTETLYTQQYF